MNQLTTTNHTKYTNGITKNLGGVIMSDWGKVKYNKGRDHYYVSGYWQGKQRYFSQYQSVIGPVTCTTPEMAERLRIAINSDMERGIFNPARYQASKPLHLKKFAASWLKERQADLASGTHHNYQWSIDTYIVPAIGDRFLPDIGHDDLKVLMRSMEGLTTETKRNVFGVLRTLLGDAMRSGHIVQLPPWIQFRGTNAGSKKAIKYLSVEDQLRIIEHIPTEDRHIFLFMMGTGCRPSEARAIRKCDIKDDCVMFEVAYGAKGELKDVKQKRAEPFPMTQEIKSILDDVPKHLGQNVFINPRTGRHYSRTVVTNIWNQACSAAGIGYFKLYNAVRHSFACQLLNLGVSKNIVSRLLRHTDIKMTDRYAFYETATLAGDAGRVRRFQKKAG